MLHRLIDAIAVRLGNPLKDVRGPTEVRVRGTVVAPETVRSPMTPVDAAVLRWTLLKQLHNRKRNDRDDPQFYAIASDDLWASHFVVETTEGAVQVPTRNIHVEYATPADRNPRPITESNPLFDAYITSAGPHGGVFYNERYLCAGDKVSLRATVVPQDSGGGPYRGVTHATPFRADPDLGEIRIIELPLDL